MAAEAITVCTRVRPAKQAKSAVEADERTGMIVLGDQSFAFDYAAGPSVTQVCYERGGESIANPFISRRP